SRRWDSSRECVMYQRTASEIYRDGGAIRSLLPTTALSLATLVIVGAAGAGCASDLEAHDPLPEATVNQASSHLSSANLQLKVLGNSCGANQAQDFFQITNTGTTPVTLSDITIKFWIDEVSGAQIVPVVNTGGCVTNVNG